MSRIKADYDEVALAWCDGLRVGGIDASFIPVCSMYQVESAWNQSCEGGRIYGYGKLVLDTV